MTEPASAKKEATKEKTALTENDRFERDVIRATRRKPIPFIDWEGKDKVIHLLPLPESLLTEGFEALSEVITEGINHYLHASLQVNKASKIEAISGESLEFLDNKSIIRTIKLLPTIVEYFIDNGTDWDYKDLKHDFPLCMELIFRILDHNIPQRLQNFFSPGGRKLARFLPGVPSLGSKPSSLNGDTQEPI